VNTSVSGKKNLFGKQRNEYFARLGHWIYENCF